MGLWDHGNRRAGCFEIQDAPSVVLGLVSWAEVIYPILHILESSDFIIPLFDSWQWQETWGLREQWVTAGFRLGNWIWFLSHITTQQRSRRSQHFNSKSCCFVTEWAGNRPMGLTLVLLCFQICLRTVSVSCPRSSASSSLWRRWAFTTMGCVRCPPAWETSRPSPTSTSGNAADANTKADPLIVQHWPVSKRWNMFNQDFLLSS